MNWRHYLILFIVGLLVPFGISRFQSMPGYMDADYYFVGGIQLAEGKGFTEPYLWNYLDDPAGLPHPSHTYWMPLASIVSAIGMWITGQSTYAAGSAAFILLSALVPLVTAALAYSVSRQTRLAMVSGLLSIFSLYYAPFMPVPDNYVLYMLFGGVFLLLVPRREKWIPVALGALAGLLTLARSDGLLWLGLAGLTVMWKSASKADGSRKTFGEWFKLHCPGRIACPAWLLDRDGWLAHPQCESIWLLHDSRWWTFALAPKLQPDLYLSAGQPDTGRLSASRLGCGPAESSRCLLLPIQAMPLPRRVGSSSFHLF